MEIGTTISAVGNLMKKNKKLREIKVKIHKKIMKNYAK